MVNLGQVLVQSREHNFPYPWCDLAVVKDFRPQEVSKTPENTSNLPKVLEVDPDLERLCGRDSYRDQQENLIGRSVNPCKFPGNFRCNPMAGKNHELTVTSFCYQ